MRRVPIRLRLAAAFALAMAAVLTATGWFLHARLESDLSAALDRSLRLRAQDLLPLVRGSDLSLADASGTPFVEKGESYAQILGPSGSVLDGTEPLGDVPLLDGAEIRDALRGTILRDRPPVPGLDEPSRVLATRVVRDGHRLVLVVGATAEDRAEALESLRNELLVVFPIAVALASLAGYGLAGLALRPVESMRRRAATISAETPGDRLPVPATHDEVERLGETLNQMLERLQLAIERQRSFVADAGHELRTPLALLRSELELALRHALSPDELRDAVRRSSDEVERLTQLAEGLLLVAGREGQTLPLRIEAIAASEILETVAARFEWRAQESGRRLHVKPAAITVTCDRLRLEQAVGNLVDNALRHGAGDVELGATAADGYVELHVLDHGPGFPPAFIGRAFERFSRPDPARTAGGAGLGLSIVLAIAEAHGGTARVANRPGSGADTWIALPGGGSGADERTP